MSSLPRLHGNVDSFGPPSSGALAAKCNIQSRDGAACERQHVVHVSSMSADQTGLRRDACRRGTPSNIRAVRRVPRSSNRTLPSITRTLTYLDVIDPESPPRQDLQIISTTSGVTQASGSDGSIWTTVTAEPRAAHHLCREREHVFRQFRLEVGRLSGRDGEIPGVDEKVTCPQFDECCARNFSDGQPIGAGKGPGSAKVSCAAFAEARWAAPRSSGSGVTWPPARIATRWLPAMTWSMSAFTSHSGHGVGDDS
jgi:hypothetical protein